MLLPGSLFGSLGYPSCPSSFVQCCWAQSRPRLGAAAPLWAPVFSAPPWDCLDTTLFGHLKRVPVSPWNRMHLQHHAKPNCFHEDPDINTQHKCFLTGSGLCCLSALCGVFSVLLPSGMGAEGSASMITFYVPILLVDMPCWEQKASWAFSSWSGSWKATALCG